MIPLLLLACAVHDLRAVPPGATPVLPDDHGPHDDAQTEWWHVHAELVDVATGEPLRLFAAFVAERTDLDRALFLPVPLAVNPFHTAYVRLANAERAWVADRESFPDFFSAGFSGEGLDLHHGDWRIRHEGGAVVLRVGAGPASTELTLTPTRAPALPGEGGRVKLRPGGAHLWVQEERMAVRGRWVEGGRVRWVEGTAFYKHQWGRLYDPDVDGFEWISADLPDGRSLSVAWLMEDGMRGARGSSAWLSAPDGTRQDLDPAALRVVPTRTWRSARSGATWPVAWTVRGEGLDLAVEAETPAQELWVFPAAIWAGPARVTGTVDGAAVDLVGFAEQVGADAPALRALYRSDPPPGSEEEEPPPPPPEPAPEGPSVPWTLQLGAEVEEAP